MRIPTFALLLALAASPAAAAEAQAAKPAAPAAPAAPAPKPADADKALNAVGLSIAKSLEPLTLSPAELDKVLAGIKEGLGGKAKQPLDDKAQENLRNFVQGRMAAAAEKEKARGTAYLDAAAKEKGAIKTANGAILVPIKEGTGASPAATDKVKVHYTGTLVDGKVFDCGGDGPLYERGGSESGAGGPPPRPGSAAHRGDSQGRPGRVLQHRRALTDRLHPQCHRSSQHGDPGICEAGRPCGNERHGA